MIGVWLMGGPAVAAEGHLDLLAGARTAPDAALEQPSEWEPEFEPTGVAALVGGLRSFHGEAWLGLDGEVWGVAPEPDAALFGLGPRAGLGATVGAARFELAGRYDGQVYPVVMDATNGRAEGLASAALEVANVRPFVTVEAVDRTYWYERRWSFRTGEAGGGLEVTTTDTSVRATLSGGWQVNQGNTSGGSAVMGQQVRGLAGIGVSARHVDGFVNYQLIHAWNGAADEAARSQFTPLGAYSADADALSAGGFLQHRVEIGASADMGDWTLRASVLGRLRDADPAAATYARSAHGQLDVRRTLDDHLSGFLTVGVSRAEVVSGRAFTDAYAWLGVTVGFGPPSD